MLKTPYHNIRPLYVSRMLKNICPLPIKANTYHGCPYGCVYCNGQVLTKSRNERSGEPIPLGYMKRTFTRAFNGTGKGEIHRAIRKRWPAQLGVLADPFPPTESQVRNTLEFMRFMNVIGYSYMILTKSDMILEVEYLELLDDNVQVVISIPFMEPGKLEPNVPTPTERFGVLEELIDLGVKCTLRVWPIIPTVNEDIKGIVETAQGIGVKEITGAYLHLYNNRRYLENLNTALGYDILSRCEEAGVKVDKNTKYYMAEDKHRVRVLKGMKQQCTDAGISFYTPNSPVMNSWECCCGNQLGGCNEHALKMKGYRLREGVTLNEYLPEGYPFWSSFEKSFLNGDFCKTFNDIVYDNNRMIYKVKGEE